MEYDAEKKEWVKVIGLTLDKDKYQTNPDGHEGKCRLCRYNTADGKIYTCTGCGHVIKGK
jgi:hypothetical protein